ncbi:hypothetical protein D3C85_883940 [compost metagenome]
MGWNDQDMFTSRVISCKRGRLIYVPLITWIFCFREVFQITYLYICARPALERFRYAELCEEVLCQRRFDSLTLIIIFLSTFTHLVVNLRPDHIHDFPSTIAIIVVGLLLECQLGPTEWDKDATVQYRERNVFRYWGYGIVRTVQCYDTAILNRRQQQWTREQRFAFIREVQVHHVSGGLRDVGYPLGAILTGNLIEVFPRSYQCITDILEISWPDVCVDCHDLIDLTTSLIHTRVFIDRHHLLDGDTICQDRIHPWHTCFNSCN